MVKTKNIIEISNTTNPKNISYIDTEHLIYELFYKKPILAF